MTAVRKRPKKRMLDQSKAMRHGLVDALKVKSKPKAKKPK
jgi:hypothetical protein